MIYSGIERRGAATGRSARDPRRVWVRGRGTAGPVRRPAGRAEAGRRPLEGARPAPARSARRPHRDRRRRPAARRGSKRPRTAYHLDGRVRFLGHRDDVPRLLAAADLVVLPSAYEGLPNVVLEAMRFRKPVVATAAPGTTEVVVDGQTGLLVPIGNDHAPGPGDPRRRPRPRAGPPPGRGRPSPRRGRLPRRHHGRPIRRAVREPGAIEGDHGIMIDSCGRSFRVALTNGQACLSIERVSEPSTGSY